MYCDTITTKVINYSIIKDKMQELLTMADVCKILKIHHNYVYNMLKNGKFPAPIIISKRKHRWLPSDIENWINEKHNNRF